jgi:hypothetical protein
VSLYFYTPTAASAIAFTVLFFLLTCWHAYVNTIFIRSVTNKHKYTICLSIACLLATLGWGVRIISINNDSSISLYAISACLIIISPIFVCASLYLLLTSLIRATLPVDHGRQKFFGVAPLWLGRIFICSDVFSFLTQGAGSGIASSGNWEGDQETIGMSVLLFGLSLQLATFCIFLGLFWLFVRRVKLAKDVGLNPCVKKVVFGVWLAGGCVQVRSIYRVIEFAMGVNGYPFKHEWCLYALEGAPMFVALALLAIYHPTKWMQQKPRKALALGSDVTDGRRPNQIMAMSKSDAV